jgi:hypothetical protein
LEDALASLRKVVKKMTINTVKPLAWALAACTVGIVGCDEPEQVDAQEYAPINDAVTYRSIADNGIEANGWKVNGWKVNGWKVNGFITGVLEAALAQFTDLQFHSGSLLKVWHPGSGTWKVGSQLNGMTFDIDFEVDGIPQAGQIRINNVWASGAQPDVYFYEVQNWVGGNWVSACVDGAGNPTEAIAVEGNFDSATGSRTSDVGLTWACRGAAIAKAIEWGYRPWVNTSHKNHHQAAVRMIRADYCGNGVHHTTNGNPIDVADSMGIQTHESAWNIEAGWGVNGAVCVNTPRKLYWPKNTLNPCSNLPACGTNPITQMGALLTTRAVPNSN